MQIKHQDVTRLFVIFVLFFMLCSSDIGGIQPCFNNTHLPDHTQKSRDHAKVNSKREHGATRTRNFPSMNNERRCWWWGCYCNIYKEDSCCTGIYTAGRKLRQRRLQNKLFGIPRLTCTVRPLFAYFLLTILDPSSWLIAWQSRPSTVSWVDFCVTLTW